MPKTNIVSGETYSDPMPRNGQWLVAITVDYFSPRIEKFFQTKEEAEAFIIEKTTTADQGAK